VSGLILSRDDCTGARNITERQNASYLANPRMAAFLPNVFRPTHADASRGMLHSSSLNS